MRALAIAAVTGLVLLAACDTQTDPSPPPTTQDALTTTTAAPPPIADPDTDATTDAAPTTAEPTTEEPTAGDGPPEMPPEAMEQTEEGAEAFALHYIDLVNYTGRYPTLGLLEPLAQENCQSCANRVEAVAYGVEYGDHLREDTFRAGNPETLLTSESARVAIPVQQLPQNFYREDNALDRRLTADEATLVIRLDWESGWSISEITIDP